MLLNIATERFSIGSTNVLVQHYGLNLPLEKQAFLRILLARRLARYTASSLRCLSGRHCRQVSGDNWFSSLFTRWQKKQEEVRGPLFRDGSTVTDF
jgi:hypothetical protein